MAIQDWTTNQIDLQNKEAYTAIIGAAPSQGARSPHLWNAVSEHQGIKAKMICLDVATNKNEIEFLMHELKADKNFLGGAVTMPYKEIIATLLNDHLTPNAVRIGAINCLFRDKAGNLCGTNTDGEAALNCLNTHIAALNKTSNPMRVLQLGAGGAGKAVAAFVASDNHELTLAVRTPEKISEFAESIRASVIPWSEREKNIEQFDLVVNTTNIGFCQNSDEAVQSPLSTDAIANLQPTGIVYDIIYDPYPTVLLDRAKARGLQILDGRDMNLVQAVLGYHYAFPEIPVDKIREVMTRKREALDKK